MKSFVQKLLLFILFPLVLTSIFGYIFIEKDPYMDFKSYKNYSWKYNFQSIGDLSTKKLLQSNVKYNSFIFGSSRSMSVYACYLQKQIPGSKFFQYSNFSETIGGINNRLNLIDSLGYPINNAFIFIDTDNSFANAGRPKINDHFLINKESKELYYYNQVRYLFTDLNAFKVLLGYPVENEPNLTSDLSTNDSKHICSESTINSFGDSLMSKSDQQIFESSKKHGGVFYKRPAKQEYLNDQISAYDEKVMRNIRNLFIKHHSTFYIIISPIYDQLKFSKNDMQKLRDIFGNRIYDFSGQNRFTDNDYNYPDGIHFRHHISKQIIDSVIQLNKITYAGKTDDKITASSSH